MKPPLTLLIAETPCYASYMQSTLVSPNAPLLRSSELRGSDTLLISDHSLPEADAAVRDRGDGETEIAVQYFEDYLRFLEVICWFDSLVIGHVPVCIRLPKEHISKDLLKLSGKYGCHTGKADLREKTLSKLTKDGIVKNRVIEVDDETLTPDIYIRRMVESSPEYGAKLNLNGSWGEKNAEEQLVWYSINHGTPYALTEVARRSGVMSLVPTMSHNVDVAALDRLEKAVSTGVKSKLIDKLSAGAKREIEALEALGAAVQLPPSPVCGWILREAQSKDDMVTVALQLRSQLKVTRDHIFDLQREMLDVNLPVKTRLSRAKEIKRILAKLDPQGSPDVRREIQSHSSMIDSIKESMLDGKEFSVKKASDILLSKPVEFIINKFRDRKFRTVFDLKHKFLDDAGYHSKVVKLLGFDSKDPKVRISMEYCSHATLNSWNIIRARQEAELSAAK